MIINYICFVEHYHFDDDNMTGSISLIRIQCGNNFYFVSLDEDKRIQNKKHTNSV